MIAYLARTAALAALTVGLCLFVSGVVTGDLRSVTAASLTTITIIVWAVLTLLWSALTFARSWLLAHRPNLPSQIVKRRFRAAAATASLTVGSCTHSYLSGQLAAVEVVSKALFFSALAAAAVLSVESRDRRRTASTDTRAGRERT